MKFGYRIPSFKGRVSARTSWKRVLRHRAGLKAPRGWGWFTNPKKAAYNRVYNRTTVDILKGSSGRRQSYATRMSGSGLGGYSPSLGTLLATPFFLVWSLVQAIAALISGVCVIVLKILQVAAYLIGISAFGAFRSAVAVTRWSTETGLPATRHAAGRSKPLLVAVAVFLAVRTSAIARWVASAKEDSLADPSSNVHPLTLIAKLLTLAGASILFVVVAILVVRAMFAPPVGQA